MGVSGHDDLDQLVSELNLTVAAARQASADAADTSAVVSWLRAVREADGSDLLLVPGRPPTVRASGRLLRLSEGALDQRRRGAAVVPFVPRRLEERYRGRRSGRSRLHASPARTLPDEPASRAGPRGGGDSRAADAHSASCGASTSRTTSRSWRGCRAAWCSSADRPARERPRRSRRLSKTSTPAKRVTSSPSRIRSSTSIRTAAASSSRWRSASMPPTSRPRCARPSGRRRTSSSSARCAIRRRCASR